MKTKVEVRKRTFEDLVNEIHILDLPVLFTGNYEECLGYCRKQEGYIEKFNCSILYGKWYYNFEESVALILT